MLNIYGKGTWATKITSLLKPGEFAQYDESDYPQAGGDIPWVIALEDGDDRISTIGDNVTIYGGVTIPDNTVIPSGTVVQVQE